MVNFVVIGIIIVFVFFFFKITSFRYERWWTYLIAVLMIFLLFSFFSVVKKNNLELSSPDGFFKSMKTYTAWLFGLGKNVATITGKVTAIDWNVTQNSSGTG